MRFQCRRGKLHSPHRHRLYDSSVSQRFPKVHRSASSHLPTKGTDSKMPSSPPPDYKQAASEHGLGNAPAPKPTGPVRRPLQSLNLPIINHLNSKRVVLASASPRRKALLQQVRIPPFAPVGSNRPRHNTNHGNRLASTIWKLHRPPSRRTWTRQHMDLTNMWPRLLEGNAWMSTRLA